MPLALTVSFRAPVGGAKKTRQKPIRRGGVVAPVAVFASDKYVVLTASNDARARAADITTRARSARVAVSRRALHSTARASERCRLSTRDVAALPPF